MKGIPAAIIVAASFLLFYGALAASATWVAPLAVRAWPPVEPIEITIAGIDPRIPLGHPIPSELKSEKLPLILIVHVDCLACGRNPPRNVVEAFEVPNAVNLVLASDIAEYEAVARRAGNARLVRGGARLAQHLRAGFGPRVYAFDRDGILVFVQNHEGHDLKDVIHEARKLL